MSQQNRSPVNQAVIDAHANNSPIQLPVGTCKYDDTIVLTEDIDIIGWGEDGRITSFKVMARPIKGLMKVIEHMGTELTK